MFPNLLGFILLVCHKAHLDWPKTVEKPSVAICFVKNRIMPVLLLRNKLGQSGQAIENAHRIGKTGCGQPRQIIVRFFSRQTRADVFRAARAGLRQDLSTTWRALIGKRNAGSNPWWTSSTKRTSGRSSETAGCMRKTDLFRSVSLTISCQVRRAVPLRSDYTSTHCQSHTCRHRH